MVRVSGPPFILRDAATPVPNAIIRNLGISEGAGKWI